MMRYLLVAAIMSLVLVTAACGKAVPPKQPGTLIVTTQPTEATVTIADRSFVSLRKPLARKLRPGNYRVSASATRASDGVKLLGETTARVTSGKITRVGIYLTPVTLVPAESSATALLVATSEAQKSVLDFFAAISAKNFFTAYAMLTDTQRLAYRGLYAFKKYWFPFQSVAVSALHSRGSAEGREALHVVLSVSRTVPGGEPRVGREELNLSATAVRQSGAVIWKLEGFPTSR